MKIELAENQSEITLGQFQEYEKLTKRTDLNEFEFYKRKVKIFTGLSYHQITLMKYSDLKDFVNTIDKALNQEVEFKPTFKIGDVQFGFIPNFDDISANEYFDLSTYDTEIETLHKLMAILFRPVKVKSLGKYEIVGYKGTNEWCEVMKQMPLSIVNGALFFFLNLAKDLENYILKFTTAEQVKKNQSNTLKNGVGIRQFIEWLRVSSGSLRRSVN